MSNLENVKLSNTSKMIVAAAAVTAGTLVQVNQNNQMVNADDTKATVKNLGQAINTYKIQSGDTLTKIAKANDVSLDDLVKFNGIADKNMIIVGETLQLSANDDEKATDVTTGDTYTAVDGTDVADLQYNANADADHDNFMTISEYNAWVNGGRQETVVAPKATTEDNKSTETAVSEATTETTSSAAASSDANAAVDGKNIADLQYNANADADHDNFMTVSEYNAWVNGGRQETVATPKTTTEDNKSTETVSSEATKETTSSAAASSDANAAVDGKNVADLQYNANADADHDNFMTVSEYNAWVNGGRQETVATPKATTEDNKSTETVSSEATKETTSSAAASSDANAAVDGKNVADLQYNANADADNDGFMTVSEYNAWVNGGRQETVATPKATTEDNKSTETVSSEATKETTSSTAASSDANAAVDGKNVADLQYNANADADNDGFMTVSEYNAWVNGGRQETVATPKATTNDNKSTETTTTTNNNSQNQGSWYDVAMSLVGIPYVWGGHTPASGLDCSGFTAWVYNHSGMTSNFPAYTVAQENATTSISVSAAQPGDLLFWGTPGATYHVGIYLGNNQFIAAPQPGDVVRVQTLTAGWMPSFAGTLR